MEVVYRPSIQLFEKAIQLDSGFIDAWAGLMNVECYLYLNEPSEALKGKIERQMAYVNNHFPDSWQKKFMQGEFAYRIIYNYEDATKRYVEVLQEDPENSFVSLSLSGVYRRQMNYSMALQYARRDVNANPTHTSGWKNLAAVLTVMGDLDNALRARMKSWEISRKRSDAEDVLYVAMQGNRPVDQLPDELKRDAGAAFTIAKEREARNWKQVRKLSLDVKDYSGAAEAYLMLGQRDSARYWSRTALKGDSLNIYLKILSASNIQQALAFIHEEFADRVKYEKEAFAYEMAFGILANSIFGQYRQATEMLIKLNNDFPELGYYEWLNDPMHDKIKKEYPAFQEALNNLKRRPLPDASKSIKW